MHPRISLRQIALGVSFFVLVFLSAWISIQTRSIGGVAVFWLPNALLLGLWVRFPHSLSILSICGATLGYLTADLSNGTELALSLVFTSANFLSIGIGYFLVVRIRRREIGVVDTVMILQLFLAVLGASAFAALFVASVGHLLFHWSFMRGWAHWFVAESVNYVTILPVLLAIPEINTLQWRVSLPFKINAGDRRCAEILPFGCLVVVGVLAFSIGGPGAIAFPLPALLWCAVTYELFTVSGLILLFGIWSQLGITMGVFLPVPEDVSQDYLQLSLLLGVAFIAVCPTMLVVVMLSRNRLLDELKMLASRDTLSELKNRRAFFEEAADLSDGAKVSGEAMSLLMIDIDNFKGIQ